MYHLPICIVLIAVLQLSQTVTAQQSVNNCHCSEVDCVFSSTESRWRCENWLCDIGWNNAPYCDQRCDEGDFGQNCASTCHCPPDDTCRKDNGVCLKGRCATGWYGSSCQIRLPRLRSLPELTNLTCNSVTVNWNRWNETVDDGNPPVHSYILQHCQANSTNPTMCNNAGWISRNIPEPQSDLVRTLSYPLINLIAQSQYHIRVITNRDDDGKPIRGAATDNRTFVTCPTTPVPPTTPTRPTTTTTTPTTTTPLPVPEPIATLNITADERNASLVWEIPEYNRLALTILNYEISYTATRNKACPSAVISPSRRTLPVTVTYRDLIDLTPFTMYSVRVRIHYFNLRTRSNESSSAFTSSFDTLPSVPTRSVENLRIGNITSASFIVNWNEFSCDMWNSITLLGYNVTVTEPSSGLQESISLGRQTTYQFLNRLPNVLYIVEVQAVTEQGSGPWSNRLDIRTLDTVPPAVINLAASGLVNERANITWSLPQTTISYISYSLSYRLLGPETCPRNTGTSTAFNALGAMHHLLEGLNPYSRYSVTVQVVNNIGRSEPVTLEFISNGVAPMTVINLVASVNVNTDRNSVVFIWAAPNCTLITGPNTRYRVQIFEANMDNVEVDDIITATEAQVTNIRSSTVYGIRIRVINDIDAGSWSGWSNFTTPVDVAPLRAENLTTLSVSRDSISVSWNYPITSNNNQGASYRLIYQHLRYGNCTNNNPSPPATVELSVSSTQYTISDLEPWSTYSVKITSYNSIGSSDADAMMIVTLADTPLTGPIVTSTNEIGGQVTVNWTLPVCSILRGALVDFTLRVSGPEGLLVPNTITPNTSATFDVRPNAEYRMDIRIRNELTRGPWGPVVVYTAENVKPAAFAVTSSTTGLKATEVSINRIRSSDDYSQGVVYTLYYRRILFGTCGPEEEPHIGSVVMESNAYRLPGLSPFSQYDFTINARNDKGQINQTIPAATKQSALTAGVTDMSISQSGTSIVLTWTPPSCVSITAEIVHLNCRLSTLTNEVSQMQLNASSISWDINYTVSPSTSYRATVQLIASSAELNSPSSQLSFTTNSEVPGKPARPSVTSVTQTRIALHWTRDTSAGPILAYNVIISSAAMTWNKSYTGDTTEDTLIDLSPYTSYAIRMRSQTSAGWSVLSDPLIVRTQAPLPSAPDSLSSRGISTSSCIYLQWTAPSNLFEPVLDYKIYYYPSLTSSENANEIITPDNSTQYDLCGLQPASEYEIFITARTRAGEGSPVTTSDWTRIKKPPIPPVPVFVSASLTTLTIKFFPVNQAQITGPITAYRVRAGIPETVIQAHAEIPADTVGEAYQYTIGSGDATGGGRYTNQPLSPAQIYEISISVVSSMSGVTLTTLSPVLHNVSTLAAVNLNVSTYNTTCLHVNQLDTATASAPQLLHYKIWWRLLRTPLGQVNESDSLVNGPVTRPENVEGNLLCSLQPGSQYEVNVSAVVPSGDGPIVSVVDVWTRIGTPSALPFNSIRITSALSTATTISLLLYPVSPSNGPISAYMIWVKKLGPMVDNGLLIKKRSLTDEDIGEPYAEIPTGDAAGSGYRFTVGDNRTTKAGRYWNKPLSPYTRYKITYVVSSSQNDVTEYAFTSVEGNTLKEQLTVWQIVLIVLCALLAAALVALLIWYIVRICRRRRGDKYTSSKGRLNETDDWVTYYKDHHAGDGDGCMYMGFWSPIYDLSEKRHIVFDQTVDHELVDPNNGKPYVTFEQEFNDLPRGQQARWTVAAQHSDLNRVQHLVAYDHSRVKVSQSPLDTDYINASFVDGYSKTKKYIATASPFSEDCMLQFWQMVYEQNVSQIVMMTNMVDEGIVKCLQYWPVEANTRIQYGLIQVDLMGTQFFAQYTIHTLRIAHAGDNKPARLVTQFHYTGWPEHGVPQNAFPLLDFRQAIRNRQKVKNMGPIVVHCGTGCSTTGFFIALDYLLDEADQSHSVSVFKCVSHLRENRCFLVRTQKQYLLLYDCLFEHLLGGDKRVSHDLKSRYKLLAETNPTTGQSYWEEEIEQLERFSPDFHKALFNTALSDKNIYKNRYNQVIPPDQYRVKLSLEHGTCDYINAVLLDGYRRRNSFIMTQTPLHHTVIDFWRMIYEYGVCSIVMMDDPYLIDETCAIYWPVEDHQIQQVLSHTIGGSGDAGHIVVFGEFVIELVAAAHNEHSDVCIIRHLQITNKLRPNDYPRHVKQFQIKEWPLNGRKLPKTGLVMLKIMDAVEKWRNDIVDLYSQTGTSPIVVHCLDGASHSGVFVAAASVCEKMGGDEQVNMFLTIKEIKHRRKEAINGLPQYKYLHRVLWDFIKIQLDSKYSTDGTDSLNNHNNMYSSITSQAPTTVTVNRTNEGYTPYEDGQASIDEVLVTPQTHSKHYGEI